MIIIIILKTQTINIELLLKNKLLIVYGRFKVIYKKNDDNFKGLLSTEKRFNDDIGMHFGHDKRVKVMFTKGS